MKVKTKKYKKYRDIHIIDTFEKWWKVFWCKIRRHKTKYSSRGIMKMCKICRVKFW